MGSPPQKKGYTPAVQNKHHEAIESSRSIKEVMQNQQYEMEGVSQVHSLLISSNCAAMAQLAQFSTSMGTIQAQLKNVSSSSTTRKKIGFYCWRCGINFYDVINACPTNRYGHKVEAYYLKKTWEQRKGVTMMVKENNE